MAPSALRKVPIQRRAQSTVRAILDATATVLIDGGLRSLNTNAVARTAGVNIATLYRYFSTKEELVAALWEEQCKVMLAIMEETATAMWDAPVEDKVRHYVAGLIRFHARDPALHHELRYAVAAFGVKNPPELDRREVELLRLFLELHRDEITPSDLDLAVFVLYSTVDHLINDAMIKRPDLVQDGRLEREIVAFVLGYLLSAR